MILYLTILLKSILYRTACSTKLIWDQFLHALHGTIASDGPPFFIVYPVISTSLFHDTLPDTIFYILANCSAQVAIWACIE